MSPNRSVPPASSTLPAPRALLLDFGGVVVTTVPRDSWAQELAAELVRRAGTLDLDLDPAVVQASLRSGRRALSLWKDAASRPLEPRELDSREIVADYLLADLPDVARRAFALDAGNILARMAHLVADHHLRPGIPALLEEARRAGLPLAIVSNAHSGRAHRDILASLGIGEYFGVQVYSDEIGIRKPHPGMIHRAAEALGVGAGETWYVGDTLDRDVAAGRRAGVGAVIITRDRRTDSPPFRVPVLPDLVCETPEGLVAPLRGALAAPRRRERRDAVPPTAVPSAAMSPVTGPRPALLLDHGGVITTSRPHADRHRILGARISELSDRIGAPIDPSTATHAVEQGWERHRARKRERDRFTGTGHVHDEIEPAVLWGDLVGADLPDPLRAALRLESTELSLALHRAKSTPTARPGAIELIRWCHEHGVVVGIVSNTISGCGVREILAHYGVADLIGPAAYSDEIGVRKPGTAIFDAALAGLDTPREHVLYAGDKVVNDGHGAREAGIGTVCLLRGGKDSDADLEAADTRGTVDHVLDSPTDLIDLIDARLSTRRRAS